jgi:hypothetical protein
MAKVLVGCSVNKIEATCEKVSGCMGGQLAERKKSAGCEIQVCTNYFCHESEANLTLTQSARQAVRVMIPQPKQLTEESQWLKGWNGWTSKFSGVVPALSSCRKDFDFAGLKEPYQLMSLFKSGQAPPVQGERGSIR